MIKFESIGQVSATKVKGSGLYIGKQVGSYRIGVAPTYGVTCRDMGFEYFLMTVGFN